MRLLTLLCLVLWLPLGMSGQTAQFVAEELPGFRNDALDYQFKDYQIYQMDVDALRDHLISRDGVIPFHLNLGNNYRWNLELMKNDLFAEDFKMVVQTEDGQITESVANTAYKGWNTTGNMDPVRLTLDTDFILGYVQDQGNTWYIEPLRYYVDGAAPGSIVFYNMTDVIEREDNQCALVDQDRINNHIDDQIDQQQDGPATSRMGCLELDLAIASDWLMFSKYGSCGGVNAHLTGILNLTQGDYDTDFSDEISILQVTHFCSSCSTCDPWTSSTDPFALLPDFRTWASGGGFGVTHDMGQLWSARDFDGSVVGLAYVGTVCTGSRYHINQDYTSNTNSLRQLNSHEMGHNWSATHDGSGTFIMSPSINGSSTWSAMSISQINTHISTRTCLASCVDCTNDTEPPVITSAPGAFDQTINMTDPLGSCPDEWSSIGWSGGTTSFTFQDGSNYQFFADIQGTDNCDNDLQIDGCYSSCGLVSFDGCTAVYESTWRLTDDAGNQSPDYIVRYTFVDQAIPSITSPLGAFDQTINLTDPLGSCPDEWQSIGWGGGNTTITFQDGSSYTFFADVQGADNCDNDLDIEGCFTSCGQVSFDGCTAVYESGWRLRDDCGNLSDETYIVRYTFVDQAGPAITSAPGVFDQTINLTDPLGSCPDEWQSIGWGGGNTTITFQDGSSYTFFADVQGADNCDNDLDIEGCYTSCGLVSFDGCTAVFESGWRLRDDCGNLSDETYIVRYTFVDAAPPQITSAPGAFDQTINLTDPNGSCPDEWQSISWGNGTTTITFQDGSVYSLNANIQGTDNCDNTFSIEGCFTSCGLVSFDGCSAVYESTWRLDDGCGNLSEDYVVRYTFVDQADPVITSAPGAFDQTINLTDPFGSCPDEWQSISWGDGTTTITFQDGSVYSFDANIQGFDNCDDNLTISGCFTSCGLVSSDECSAVYESGWRLEDDCGNITDDTYIVRYTFVDAAPPVIDPQAMNMTVECDGQGNTDEFDAWIADNGGADGADACTDVTWSVQSQNFFPDCGATGIWDVTFALTDECNNTATTSALFIIEDTTPPQLTEEAADETVECDGMGNVGELQAWLANNGGADAYDRCGAEIWSNDYDPANFVPLCGNTGYVDVTFTVEDECGNVGPSTTARFEIVDTTPPSIDVPASDLEVACGEKTATANQTYWLDNLAGAQASDICSNVTWSYELLTENEICESTGSVTFAFTATDDCGNSSTTIATYTKYDQAPPEIYLPFAEKEQACGTEPDWGYVYAEDECDLDVINMTWTETYEEGDCDHAYSISRTWIAMDDCGNMTSATQTITYDDDDAPELSFTEDSQFYGLGDGDTYVVDCADLLPFNEQDVVAEDNCTVGFMQVSMEGGREFGNCNDDGYIERWPWTFTAEDECGNVGSLSITIELVDNSAPVFTLVPDDKTIGCMDEVEFDDVEVEDDCNTRFSLTFEDVVEDTACPDTHYERTWTATDVCGNESSATQRIAQLDQDPPVFVTVPDDQTLGCDADPDWGEPEVTDDCGSVDVTFVDDDMMGDCDTGYTITRTWIATDECGNTSTAQTVVLIIDNSIIVDRNSENNDPDRETGGPSTAVLRDKPNTDTEELAIDHRLYPNPVEWELTVEWSSPEPGDWSIEVRNMHGQLVAMDNIQVDTGLAKYQLEVDKYEAGMYFITVRSGERTWSDRFIKF